MTARRFLTTEDRALIEHRSVAAIHCDTYRGDDVPPSIVVGKRRLWPEDEYLTWLAQRKPRTRRRDDAGPKTGATTSHARALAQGGGRRGQG